MNQPALKHPYSAEDYLRNEADSPEKHEYVDGEVYAMAGAGERHNRIALNVAIQMRLAARGTPCGVFISDMKLRVLSQNSFYYPDVMFTCNADDDHPNYKVSPCVLVEVLSPSTASIDRREKWLAYRQFESLKAYLLIDSDQRHVDYYLRNEEGQWLTGQLGRDDLLNLACGPTRFSLALDDIYEDVGL